MCTKDSKIKCLLNHLFVFKIGFVDFIGGGGAGRKMAGDESMDRPVGALPAPLPGFASGESETPQSSVPEGLL
jgi:hypothetical protein